MEEDDTAEAQWRADLWRQLVATATETKWEFESEETEAERHLREDDEIPL